MFKWLKKIFKTVEKDIETAVTDVEKVAIDIETKMDLMYSDFKSGIATVKIEYKIIILAADAKIHELESKLVSVENIVKTIAKSEITELPKAEEEIAKNTEEKQNV